MSVHKCRKCGTEWDAPVLACPNCNQDRFDASSADGSLSADDAVRMVLELHPGADRLALEKLARAMAKPAMLPLTAQRISDLAWECVRDMLGDDDDDSERVNKLIRAVIGETVCACAKHTDATA